MVSEENRIMPRREAAYRGGPSGLPFLWDFPRMPDVIFIGSAMTQESSAQLPEGRVPWHRAAILPGQIRGLQGREPCGIIVRIA